MSCYIDVVGCTNNDDHNGIDRGGDCPYCEIDRLTAQLAERDAEIADLKHVINCQDLRINQMHNELLSSRKWIERGEYCTCEYPHNKDTEVSKLETENAALRGEVEQLRVQLAGCGVAAMCNTRESMQQQLCHKGDYGYSASYQDVIDAVKREIDLRDENAALRAEVERLKEHASDYGNALITVRDETRKQTAQEIEKHLLGMFWTIPYKENEPMIYRDQAIEWLRDKFGLEG